MIVFSLLMIISFFIGIQSSWVSSDIPNPKVDPKSCGRSKASASSLCDPDHLLLEENKNVIEGLMNAFDDNKAEIGVLIVSKMQISILQFQSVEKVSENFARQVHDAWGIGKKGVNDGILLFMSIEDRAVYISTGSGVQRTLSSFAIDNIINHMKPYLRRSQYGTAIEHAVAEIDIIISGKKIPDTTTGSNTKLKTFKDTIPTSSTGISKSVEDYLYAGIFLVFCIGMIVNSLWQNRRLKNLQVGKEQLSKLMKEMTDCKEGNKFKSSSCPICLEDFPADIIEPDLPSEESFVNIKDLEADNLEINDRDSHLDTYIPEVLEDLIPNTNTNNTTGHVNLKSRKPFKMNNLSNNNNNVSDEGKSDGASPLYSGVNKPDNNNMNRKDKDKVESSVVKEESTVLSDAPTRPMALRCGHIFCHACLTAYLKTAEGRKCPICRLPVDGSSPPPGPLPPGPLPPGAGPGAGPPPGPGGGGGSPPSCSAAGDIGQTYSTHSLYNHGHTHGHTHGFGFGRAAWDYRSAEFIYRMTRMNRLYPNVMTAEMLRSMSQHVETNSFENITRLVENRRVEVQRTITDIQTRSAAASSGRSGSRSHSFGGGSSSGGGGGRW